jgi:hypothetical protein
MISEKISRARCGLVVAGDVMAMSYLEMSPERLFLYIYIYQTDGILVINLCLRNSCFYIDFVAHNTNALIPPSLNVIVP